MQKGAGDVGGTKQGNDLPDIENPPEATAALAAATWSEAAAAAAAAAESDPAVKALM